MRTKIFIVSIILSFASQIANGQLPVWQIVKTAAGTDNDIAIRSCTDQFGNLLVTGNYSSTSLAFSSDTIYNPGGYNVYVAKYDPSGDEIWIRNFGGTGYETVNDITTNSKGEIFVTGTYNNTNIFGGDTLSTTNFQYSMFLLKYDSAGNEIWGKGVKGTSVSFYVTGQSIKCDYDDNVLLTGNFKSTSIIFDTITVNKINAEDIFIAKYDNSGAIQWAQSAGGIMDDAGFGIDCDSSNNIFVAGRYGANGMIIGSTQLLNNGGSDIFVAKLNPLGNVIWAKQAGGPLSESANAIAVDDYGNAYITGNFQSSVLSFGGQTISNVGKTSTFIVKYDVNGSEIWARSSVGPGNTYGYDIDTYINNGIYIAGWYDSTSVSFGNTNLFSTGGEDVFVLKYDSVGNVQWVFSPSGNLNEHCLGVNVASTGDVTITGMFESSPTTFGPYILNNSSAGHQDLFIARLATPTSVTEFSSPSQLLVWPNPGYNLFHVQLPKGVNKISIFDIQGSSIAHYEGLGTISFILEKPGMYFIKSENRNICYGKVLVIE